MQTLVLDWETTKAILKVGINDYLSKTLTPQGKEYTADVLILAETDVPATINIKGLSIELTENQKPMEKDTSVTVLCDELCCDGHKVPR